MPSVSANSNFQRDTNGNSKEGSGESRAKETSGKDSSQEIGNGVCSTKEVGAATKINELDRKYRESKIR
jgi:hypothetical protein